MAEIVRILMRRDGMSKNEAQEAFESCKEHIQEAAIEGACYDEIADIIADELGLEMDYLDELLD